MKSIGLLKIATSSLLLCSVMVGGSAGIHQSATASTVTTKQDERKALVLYKAVQVALKKGQASKAVADGEKMVALVPNDARYRQLLGEAYLAAGRFQSAETTLNDALDLSPGNEKVALKLALVKAALGKQQPAQALLREYEGRISGTDLGLALALAGDPAGATPILETVVRSTSSDARSRQNLALVYAMSNRWLEARTVAAQDLSPDLLDRRITEWASFVRPKGSWDQVASLLGVKPAYDAGQPVALALAPRSNGQALAAAAPVEQTEPVVDEQAAIAQAPPVEAYTPAAPASPEAAPVFEMASQPKSPSPAQEVPLVRSAKSPVKSAVGATKSKPKAKAPPAVKTVKSESGKFAVQLAASNNKRALAAAWSSAIAAVPALSGKKPTQTAVSVKGRRFVRLAVAGITTRAEADELCQSVRASGSPCFVRGTVVAPLAVQYAAKKPAKSGVKLAAKPAPAVKIAAKVSKPAAKPVNGAPKSVKPAPKVAAKSAAPAKPTKIAAR